jgi:hypothetical protein
MTIKSHLTKIICTFSFLALIANQQLDTKAENQLREIPRDTIAQAQGTNIPFDVCFYSDTFVRPKPTEQINLIRKEFSHRINRSDTDAKLLKDGRWKSDILTFSEYQGASGGQDLDLFTGLLYTQRNNQSLAVGLSKCSDIFFAGNTMLPNPRTQVFLFKYKLKQIRLEKSGYVFIVEPVKTGLQILHFRKARQHLASKMPMPIKVIDVSGNRLAQCGEVAFCELKLK